VTTTRVVGTKERGNNKERQHSEASEKKMTGGRSNAPAARKQASKHEAGGE